MYITHYRYNHGVFLRAELFMFWKIIIDRYDHDESNSAIRIHDLININSEIRLWYSINGANVAWF